MNTQQAYNTWAAQYDTNNNRTRDLEAHALRTTLADIPFNRCLEIGCGTGKNSEWFIQKAKEITAIDLSGGMLAKAREKIKQDNIQFKQSDINSAWTFTEGLYDLVSFSLVLEHISDLDHIFSNTSKSLQAGGYVYIGELHPFKQYAGTKARFDTEAGQQIVECFNHHISDFIQIPRKYDLLPVDINEYFDDDDKNEIPRILTLLLRKVEKLP